VTLALDPKARVVASHEQTLAVTWRPAVAPDAALYEVFSRLDLAPGPYEIRVGVDDPDGRQGGAYAYVDVPDMAKAPLSMSSVVVSVAPPVPSAPAASLLDVVPVAPTSQREFTRTDRVRTFARVYQGGTDPVVAVALRARIVDSRDREMLNEVTTFDASRFGASRAADFHMELPLTRLAPGEYLLSIGGTLLKHNVNRDVRFTVR
jgi:hypothetical protein